MPDIRYSENVILHVIQIINDKYGGCQRCYFFILPDINIIYNDLSPKIICNESSLLMSS